MKNYPLFPRFSQFQVDKAFENKQNLPFSVKTGVSKVVLVPKDYYYNIFPYVIKLPMTYDEVEEEIFEINYCERERNISDAAKQKGLQDIFPSTEFVSRYCDIPFYIQPLVNVMRIGMYKDNLSFEAKRFAESCGMSYAGAQLLLNSYKVDKADAIKNFILAYKINDLHLGNLGMINDRLVIFDYSGYIGPAGSESKNSQNNDGFPFRGSNFLTI